MPVDTSQFVKGLSDGLDRARRGAVRGVSRFSQHVMGDAQELCPKETGTLASSGVAEPAAIDGDLVTAKMGFNTDYAAPVHENLTARHAAGTQAKFLSKAMELNAPKMQAFVAGEIAAEMG